MDIPPAPGTPRPGLAAELRDSALLLGLLLVVLVATAGLSALLRHVA